MVEFMNFVLTFVQKFVLLLFSFVSIDGYSFGYMLLGALLLGAVILGIVSAVAIFSRARRH